LIKLLKWTAIIVAGGLVLWKLKKIVIKEEDVHMLKIKTLMEEK
jgi:hypothetical protein